ncbi:MAG: M48 family metallopeptidase [Tenericutes bacterium]|jgi:STE24 endopeptidase|nr:M48 family metallopeptidase [Mycoplasmatota bacterium]
MEVTIQILIYGLLLLMFGFELWLSILNYKNRNAEIPVVVKDVYEESEYKKYQRYAMTNFKFGLIIKGVNLFVIIVLLATGFFNWLGGFINSVYEGYYMQILMFLLFYYIINFVVETIFSYIRTFKIEESYGFNKMTKITFINDKIKSIILTLLFGGGIIYGLLALHNNTDWMFFVYAWAALTLIIIIVNLIYTSVIVPLFNKLKPLEDSELKTKINEFAESVGYQIDKISVMDASKRSSKLNAYFSGLGKSKRIVLYDTLIEKMSDEEIVAVLAHEIGHNKHKHIIYNLFQTVVVLSVYVLLLTLFFEEAIFSEAFGFRDLNIGFNLILYSIVLSPVLTLISMVGSFISRRFEYQADYFVKKNYDEEKLISALKKLARENYSNLTPHPLYVKLMYSHPPVASRIEALKK